ncbi:MAG TPA: DUF1905 domain-containing protein [Acidimicrobiales bacterium]|jgi:hypothetical protein|nr:DUF1905 domain-containing protein [Acidimicrobiales bacterium]
MARSRFSFTAEVWEHEGPVAWHFVSLPEEVADEIDATFGHQAKGFGSQRVEVTIGKTRWNTSIFPDRKRGTYLLPVKKEVRVSEQLAAGASAAIDLTVIDK